MFSTEEFTLGKNPISAWNVGKPSVRAHNLPYTGEFTRERNPTNVVIVGKPSAGGRPSLSISGSTLGSPVRTESVVQPSFLAPASGHTDRCTLERNTPCVMDIAEPSAVAQTLFFIGQFTDVSCFQNRLPFEAGISYLTYWRFTMILRVPVVPPFHCTVASIVRMWQFVYLFPAEGSLDCSIGGKYE